MQQVERESQDPAMRRFLMAIADAGGTWEGYTTDAATSKLRDQAELLNLIEVIPAGGGFDYAEAHALLPKGYAAIGRPMPIVYSSPLQKLSAAIRKWVSPARA